MSQPFYSRDPEGRMKVIYFSLAVSEIACESSGGKVRVALLNAIGSLTVSWKGYPRGRTGFPQPQQF